MHVLMSNQYKYVFVIEFYSFLLFFLFQHKICVQRVTSQTHLKVLSIIIVVQRLVSN
jgi:hypothetical protein